MIEISAGVALGLALFALLCFLVPAAIIIVSFVAIWFLQLPFRFAEWLGKLGGR